jgi:TusA-related sulfurtransferase
MNSITIKATTRKRDYQGLDCYQPVLEVSTPAGKIRYGMRGVLLTTRKHAKDAAEQWKRESLECGYIPNG